MPEKKNDLNNKTIVISRTDSIGDVILTLPLCAWIKDKYPSSTLIFLGKKYTGPILACFDVIDKVAFWDEIEDQPEQGIVAAIKSLKADVFIHVFPNKKIAKLVKKARVPIRVGTSHRTYHLLNCNVRPSFTRKKSDLHESQLNFKLLSNFEMNEVPTLEEIYNYVSTFETKTDLPVELNEFLKTDRQKIILHPKSQGSAVEWPIEKYIELAKTLAKQNARVYFSGTESEGEKFREFIPDHEEIIDISGRMKLDEFITFIDKADTLIACSTGPLHIAAVLNKKAIGLYTRIRPMHPGRWKPIGRYVEVITSHRDLSSPEEEIRSINVETVLEHFN